MLGGIPVQASSNPGSAANLEPESALKLPQTPNSLKCCRAARDGGSNTSNGVTFTNSPWFAEHSSITDS